MRASTTSTTISMERKYSRIRRVVCTMWPGYHCTCRSKFTICEFPTGRGTGSKAAKHARRPDSGNGAPNQAIVGDRPEEAGILALGAVVAKHVHRRRRYGNCGEGTSVGVLDVGLLELSAVEINFASGDRNAIARQAYHAFDEDAASVAILAKGDDIAAPREADAIRKRVDENVFAGADMRFHRKARHLRKTDEEGCN